jgi:hypothetical protein
MLDFCFGDQDAMVQVASEEATVPYDMCGQQALIFQEEGNFCLKCWQERTEPQI